MKTTVLAILLSAVQFVSADKSLVPLPGLLTKQHLMHLKRQDLALDKLLDYDVKGQVARGNGTPIHINGAEEGPRMPEQLKIMDELEALERKHQEKHFGTRFDTNSTRHRHPIVQNTNSYCSRAVDRLKAGPANVPELLCEGQKYTDSDFTGSDMIYWTDYNTYGQYSTYEDQINSGAYYFRNWDEVYTSANIFDPDGSISYNEAIQGGAGTGYLMATLGTIGEFPDLVKDLFLTKSKNDADAIAIKFYVRGKPWVVTIDEEMLFKESNPKLVFGKPAADEKALWAAILEKAWAKLKGNYIISGGGLIENGIRHLVGIPVFRYETSEITTNSEAEAAFDILVAADAANYLMGAGTGGTNDGQSQNSCGIVQSHSYSILAAFTMTDSSGVAHKCLLFRNPWGVATYNQEWSKDDTNWTDDLVAQTPLGVDVRTQQASEGLFIVPISKLISTNCFSDYQIGHLRDNEGYKDRWFDKENDDEQMNSYLYTPDQSIQSDLYFTVETYAHEIIPTSCTTGTISTGQTVNYPVAFLAVYNGDTLIDQKYYLDMRHQPILISSATNSGISQYTIYVKYEFVGSPHKDYTLKVYSKYNDAIYDANQTSSEIHMDGQQPSGFTDSSFTGMDNWYCPPVNNPTPAEEEQDLKDIEIKSLLDVFGKAKSIGDFFGLIWYNLWVLFIWFHLW